MGGGLFTDAAVLTERFTRTSPNDLSYDLTVNDPENVDQAVDHSHAL